MSMELQLGELWVLRRDPEDLGLRERWWLSLYKWWDHHEAVRLGAEWPDLTAAEVTGPVWLGQINRMPSRSADQGTELWVRIPSKGRDVRVWVNGTEVKAAGAAPQFQIGEPAFRPRGECELKPPEGEVVLTIRLAR